MSRVSTVVCFALVAVLAVCNVSVFAEGEDAETPSLYDRLGGVYAIAAVVDVFMDKLFVNDILNANKAIDEARKRVPAAGLKYRVTEMMCMATGGPCSYTGRDMKATHANLNITEAEWDAMIADFVATLTEFKVPEAEQKELSAILLSTKGDIVMAPAN